MKKILFFVFIAFLLANVSSHNLAVQIVKFKAFDVATQKPVKIDSVLINNVTENNQKIIKADSVDIDIISNVGANEPEVAPPWFYKSNFPNPFENITFFEVFKSDSSLLTLSLYDLLGNLILSKKEFLNYGVHQFELNGSGLKQDGYYLISNENNNIACLKLMKIGKSSGSNPVIKYIGTDNGPEIINKDKKPGISVLIVNNNIYTFTCYAKNYQPLNSGEKQGDDLSSNNTIDFLLTTNKKFNANGGIIDINGINCQYYHFSSYIYPPDSHDTSSSVTTSNFNLKYSLQNVPLPYPYNSTYYYVLNAQFLPCSDYSQDSMVVDFCDRNFTHSLKEQNFNSKSKIVVIKFSQNSNAIDSLSLKFFDKNFHTSITITDNQVDEVIHTNLILTNLPFIIDSLNNITVELTGKDIEQHLKLSYGREERAGHGAYYKILTDKITKIESINDDAYVKIVLTP